MTFVRPSADGLHGNANYFIFSDSHLLNLSATVEITKDVVGEIGFAFQLNCWSPPGYRSEWQQYNFSLFNSNILQWHIQNWDHDMKVNIIFDDVPLMTLPETNLLHAGWRLQTLLTNDNQGNVDAVHFIVTEKNGTVHCADIELLTLQSDNKGAKAPVTQMDLAPILAAQLTLVGPTDGLWTSLHSGAGTITYASTTPMNVVSSLPPGSFDFYVPVGGHAKATGEDSNSTYFALPPGPSQSIVQNFGNTCYPSFFGEKAPLTAMVALGTGINLFGVAEDGHVWTNSFNGHWRGWSPVSDGVFEPNTPVAAILGGPAGIHLFAVGKDGHIYTVFFDGSAWNKWTAVQQGEFPQGTPITLAPGGSSGIHAFGVGTNGGVWTDFFNGSAWTGWGQVQDGVFKLDTPITALAVGSAGIHLFGVGEDGRIWTDVFNGSKWLNWGPIVNGQFQQGTPVTAIPTGTAGIHLFGLGADGGVWTAFFNGSAWGGWSRVQDGTFKPGTPITAVSDSSAAIHLFGVGEDSRVWTDVFNAKNWLNWGPIQGGVFTQSTPITAFPGSSSVITLFGVGEDGRVWTNFFNGTSWQGWNPDLC